MHLRDLKMRFKERLYRFFAWFDKPIDLSKDEAEKRERLVQTYLVVFGLLLSYSGDRELQAGLMKCFIAFLIVSLLYYSKVMRLTGSKHLCNAAAITMALIFSFAFVLCYAAFAGNLPGVWVLFLLFLMIAYVVAFPLLL